MPNKQIYDTLFRDYFNDRERFLSLANAVTNTGCKNPDEVVFNNLESSFFSSLRNDLSACIGNTFVVMTEHQRTFNPNIAFRFLEYAAEVYYGYIVGRRKQLFARKKIIIPAPMFAILYDGKTTEPEQQIIRLSDSFAQASTSLELIAVQYNISAGNNKPLKQSCPYLRQYCAFTERVGANRLNGMTLDQAVAEAMHYSIDHDIMRDYLSSREKDVLKMLKYEWDEDEARQAIREVSYEEGYDKGLLASIKNLMQSQNWTPTQAMEALNVPENDRIGYLNRLQIA